MCLSAIRVNCCCLLLNMMSDTPNSQKSEKITTTTEKKCINCGKCINCVCLQCFKAIHLTRMFPSLQHFVADKLIIKNKENEFKN